MKYGAQSVQYVTFNKIIKLTHFSIVINVRKWTVPKSNISFFLDIELCAQSLRHTPMEIFDKLKDKRI